MVTLPADLDTESVEKLHLLLDDIGYHRHSGLIINLSRVELLSELNRRNAELRAPQSSNYFLLNSSQWAFRINILENACSHAQPAIFAAPRFRRLRR